MRQVLALLALICCLVNADEFDEFETDYIHEAVYDPLRGYNKGVFELNRALYNMSLRPVSGIYHAMVPSYARKGVSNFFANLSAPARAISLLISGRGRDAAQTFGGFIMNTIAGVGGVFEIAPHGPKSDFGLAAARWGVPSGAHLHLPLIGPSNVRDTLMLPLDLLTNPGAWLEPELGLSLTATDVINQADEHSALIKQAFDSVNGYALTRDYYEQARKDAQ